MLEEFREFCEDNNQAPPAPLERVGPVRDLLFWSPADPALEIEAGPGLRMAAAPRAILFQRVIYDLRYQLLEEATDVEIGDVPDLLAALDLARAWLGGASEGELPARRRPLV